MRTPSGQTFYCVRSLISLFHRFPLMRKNQNRKSLQVFNFSVYNFVKLRNEDLKSDTCVRNKFVFAYLFLPNKTILKHFQHRVFCEQTGYLSSITIVWCYLLNVQFFLLNFPNQKKIRQNILNIHAFVYLPIYDSSNIEFYATNKKQYQMTLFLVLCRNARALWIKVVA
jgi:hypothetical protein